jgi:hypothetical protein
MDSFGESKTKTRFDSNPVVVVAAGRVLATCVASVSPEHHRVADRLLLFAGHIDRLNSRVAIGRSIVPSECDAIIG